MGYIQGKIIKEIKTKAKLFTEVKWIIIIQ